MKPMRDVIRFAGALLWAGIVTLAVSGAAGELPTTPCAVRIDGDPREAFLLGAVALPEFDAITGTGTAP